MKTNSLKRGRKKTTSKKKDLELIEEEKPKRRGRKPSKTSSVKEKKKVKTRTRKTAEKKTTTIKRTTRKKVEEIVEVPKEETKTDEFVETKVDEIVETTNENETKTSELEELFEEKPNKRSQLYLRFEENRKKEIKKKKIKRLSLLALLILVAIGVILYNLRTYRFVDTFFIDKIDEANVRIIEKNKVDVPIKYVLNGSDKYESRFRVKLNDLTGEMIYIRGKGMNANIYRTEFSFDKKEDKKNQVKDFMIMFEDKVFNEISFNRNEKPVNENFYGDKTYKFPISIEDSIVKYNRLYSKTYLVNGLKYDFNYYINDGNFICEIVKFI